MIVMTIEEMQERKRELGYSYEKLAEISGIPLGTVQKILGGITKTPRYETRRALETALAGNLPAEDGKEGACGIYPAALREPLLYRKPPRPMAGRSGESIRWKTTIRYRKNTGWS